ncbi:MAG: YbjQ family protein [Lachnospirales bacterium]
MEVVTMDYIKGKRIKEVKGMVSGSIVLTRSMFTDIASSFKTIFGGELKGYTKLMENAHKKATLKLMDEARKVNANAVVSTRISTTSIMQGATEIRIYGTAVLVD